MDAFLSPVHPIFQHGYSLTEKPAYLPPHYYPKWLELFSIYCYAPFCFVCLRCWAAEFRIFGGTNDFPSTSFSVLFRTSPHNSPHTFAVHIAFLLVHYNISVQTCLYIIHRNCMTTPNAYTSSSSLSHLAMYKYYMYIRPLCSLIHERNVILN
jgi:hypothetical protein